MNNTSISLSTKLSDPDFELLSTIDKISHHLNLPYFILGAKARDIILENVFNIRSPRATLDTDLAISVNNWNDFFAVKERLCTGEGFSQHSSMAHRLLSTSLGMVDVIPFGPIEKNHSIEWPPGYDRTMNMLGFEEARAHALQVKISNQVFIPVASLACQVILKFFAWQDRRPVKKDAADIIFIMKNYLQAGNQQRLFDQHAELITDDFDYERAGAILLGRDIAEVAQATTISQLTNLLNDILRDELYLGFTHDAGESSLLSVLKDGLLSS